MNATAREPKAADVAAALMPAVDALLLATVFAQVERERVDVIQRRLLGSGRYGGNGEPKDAWHQLTEEAAARYYDDCDKAQAEAGYKLDPGYCPALIAEHDKIKAEWALIEAAAEFFPGVTNDRLLCGVKGKGGLETREEFLNLCIGLVVNLPGYTSPLERL